MPAVFDKNRGCCCNSLGFVRVYWWLDSLTPDEARKYIGEGHFAPGSMLPKVEAAVEFAESAPGRSALITLLEKAKDGVAGKTGTAIHQ